MELEEHIYLMLFERALSARNVVRGTHMRIRSPELSSFIEYLQSKKSLVSLHIHALRSFIDACTHTHISVLTLSVHLSLHGAFFESPRVRCKEISIYLCMYHISIRVGECCTGETRTRTRERTREEKRHTTRRR